MSSSDPKSKIDLLDDPATIGKTVRNAFCVDGKVEGNSVLAIIQHILLLLSTLRSTDRTPSLRIVVGNESKATEFSPQAIKKVVEEGLVLVLKSV